MMNLSAKGVWQPSVSLGLLLAGLMLVSAPAQADTINLDVSGGAALGSPPYGTVTLTQNGTTVDVAVHLDAPNAFVTTGAGDDQVFAFNANGVVAGDITIDAHTPSLAAAAGPFHTGGLGDFAFGIDCPTCAGGADGRFAADILFHVANASISDFVANADGFLFAADIISCDETACGSGNGTGNTGVVGARTLSPVPEPGTLTLLGVGFVAFGSLCRRRLVQ